VSDTELLHKSKREPVQRLEVFSGTGRRRAWTDEEKAQIIGESYARGAVSAVARQHGLTPQQLFGWRRQARRASESGPVFAPVVVEQCGAAQDGSTSQSLPTGSAVIEIAIGRATVRVAPGIDSASLQAVLRAVMAVA